MIEGLVHLHNFLRWVILILLVLSVVKSYTGWKGKKVFSPADGKVWLFTMIAAHITLVLGLYQWLAGRYGMLTTELPAGTSMMKDKFYRFFWMEHPLTMILAIVMITLGRGMAKKALPEIKKSITYLNEIALQGFGSSQIAELNETIKKIKVLQN